MKPGSVRHVNSESQAEADEYAECDEHPCERVSVCFHRLTSLRGDMVDVSLSPVWSEQGPTAAEDNGSSEGVRWVSAGLEAVRHYAKQQADGGDHGLYPNDH
jgi:hypothetical protein